MPKMVDIAKGIADMNIGDRIRNRRLALNMTQEELAKKLGYKTKGSISKIESNERELPTQKIKRFAEILI